MEGEGWREGGMEGGREGGRGDGGRDGGRERGRKKREGGRKGGRGKYLSILSKYPDKCSFARWVWDQVETAREAWQDHLHHILKLTQNICTRQVHISPSSHTADTDSLVMATKASAVT